MLLKKLEKQIVIAMKEKDVDELTALRLLKNRAQALAKDAGGEVTDEIVKQAAKKEVKQLDQTIESMQGTGRELLFQSMRQKEILKEYLPKELSREELTEIIKDLLKDSEDKPFGAKMGLVMAQLKGKADGKVITEIIKSL